jgi:beta-aspartyl-peptidase (threonine type)
MEDNPLFNAGKGAVLTHKGEAEMDAAIMEGKQLRAGTYANNASCAVSATGYGEFFIRATVAHDICALVEYKKLPLDAAVKEVIHNKLPKLGGDGGVIAIDAQGHTALDFSSEGMFRAQRRSDGKREVMIYRDR